MSGIIDGLFTLFVLVAVLYLAPRAVVRGYRKGKRNKEVRDGR